MSAFDLQEIPPELTALGVGISEYFIEHAPEFKKGAQVRIDFDFGDTIDCKIYVEIPPVLSAELRLDHRGEWQVISYYHWTVQAV